MGQLSTHVLDTAQGRPAAGVVISLYAMNGREWKLVRSATTNADGRTDAPLLAGDEFVRGTYELVFAAGDYLRAQGGFTDDPLFLDEVVVRFGVSDATAKYHVPLLLSPYGYSTYRGS